MEIYPKTQTENRDKSIVLATMQWGLHSCIMKVFQMQEKTGKVPVASFVRLSSKCCTK